MSHVSQQTIWNRPVRGTRGPRGELTRDQIAATAIGLADGTGLPSVTMRALADVLGVSAGGLYRYVRGRDELLALMADAALADLRFPTPAGDWEQELLFVARDLLRVHLAHPWLVVVGTVSGPIGPKALRCFDRCLEILAALPAGNAAKMEALAMLFGVVTLFAQAGTREPVDAGTLFSALDPEAHPHLAAVLGASGRSASDTDLFDRTIRSLLRGLLTPDPVA